MPLLNLSLITQALMRLIDASVTNSPEWPSGTTLLVSPRPPDMLTGEHTLGIYLYHIVEDAAYKNVPSPGDGNTPLRFTPMGLQLYYQLTAHSDLSAENSTLEEQLMIGLAMKALRDNPVIDDSTVIAGTTIFLPALAGRDNRLRIIFQPTPPEQAEEYWTAGTNAMRLSAYYQVSVALLEPEPITTRAGRVLTYGVHTFLRGAPRLDHSRSRVEFTIPGEATPRSVELQPAEAAIGEALTFYGTELSDDQTFLLIKSPSWSEPVEVDSIQWGVTAVTDRVFAQVQEFAGSQVVLPGIYTAMVKVVGERRMPDGKTRRFEKTSNQTPFAVAPRIDSIGPFVGGLTTVTGLNFDPALLPDETIQIYLGPDRLARVAGAPAAGEFRVVDRGTIEFRLPAAVVPGDVIPFRILIHGAESAPRWVTIP
jgi:hypothetical protein